MRGRQVCWSDPKLQKLAKQFVPAADEVWRLHNRKELDCLHFQGFCEEGHYGGPNAHGTTRQGIYCCTPSGKFLASVNTTDPRRMERMLREALAEWKAMPAKERLLAYDPAKRRDEIQRRERQYPEDGLPLRVFARDMPRKAGKHKALPSDWRSAAWNVDSLWFRQAEARTLLPSRLAKGRAVDWPAAMVQRLVRHNLVDNVRGQTNGYAASHVQIASLRTTVTNVAKHLVTVSFEGSSRATTAGVWPKAGAFDSVAGHGRHSRGVQTGMLGTATYDTKTRRFVTFELTAVGTRWGQTRYNFRHDDLDETPIGFAIVFDANDPGNRVAPAEMGAYGW